MELKERFDSVIMRHDLYRNEFEETKQQCVEIAEDFAIGFAEWVNINAYKFPTKTETRELLEQYKQIYTTPQAIIDVVLKNPPYEPI